MLTNKADYHQYWSGKCDKMYIVYAFEDVTGVFIQCETHHFTSPASQPANRVAWKTPPTMADDKLTEYVYICRYIYLLNLTKCRRFQEPTNDERWLVFFVWPHQMRYNTQIAITFLALLRNYIVGRSLSCARLCACALQRIEWENAQHNLYANVTTLWNEANGTGWDRIIVFGQWRQDEMTEWQRKRFMHQWSKEMYILK